MSDWVHGGFGLSVSPWGGHLTTHWGGLPGGTEASALQVAQS